MSLLNMMVANTMEESKTRSNHSILMEFYSLDKEITVINDNFIEGVISEKEYKDNELSLFFMTAKAKTLLHNLNL